MRTATLCLLTAAVLSIPACAGSDLDSSSESASSGDDELSGGPISNLVVGSGAAYTIQASSLAAGKKVYVDRDFTFNGVPSNVAGGTYIETANGDKTYGAGSASAMHFTVNVAGTVYVAHDKRVPFPSWLTAGFTDTGKVLGDTDTSLELFSHHYAAGATVTLGANVASAASSHCSMYSVVVVPDTATKDTTAPSVPTALTGSAIASTIVSLEWKDSTDNVGVAGYKILRGSTVLGTTLDTNYSDTTAAASTAYTYKVEAYDAAGNTSAASTGFNVTTPAPSGPGSSPYPPSTVIGSMTWDIPNRIVGATGSDLWPVTWASDNNAYLAWGDGGGFNGTNSDGRVSLGFGLVSGAPPAITTKNVWGGKNGANPATFGGKINMLISVGGTIYGTGAVFPGAAGVSHSGGADEHRLVWSKDLGKTWSYADWTFCDEEEAPICPVGFVNFGKDNAGARDSYVYAYGNVGWWVPNANFNSAFLMRAPNNALSTHSAWQYFAGLDASGNPTWSTDQSKKKPVFTDNNGGRAIGEAVYNSVLKRYIACGQGATMGETAFFDAPNPWGPWTTIAYYSNWGNLGASETLGVHFGTKWTSADGLTMWATFSSTGTLDAFNLAKVVLTKK